MNSINKAGIILIANILTQDLPSLVLALAAFTLVTNFKSTPKLAANSVLIYILLLLFGAPFQIWVDKTLLLVAYLTLLTGDVDLSDSTTLDSFLWTFMGCWIGSFLLPLDWQKDYQKYPTPLVLGSTVAQLMFIFFTACFPGSSNSQIHHLK